MRDLFVCMCLPPLDHSLCHGGWRGGPASSTPRCPCEPYLYMCVALMKCVSLSSCMMVPTTKAHTHFVSNFWKWSFKAGPPWGWETFLGNDVRSQEGLQTGGPGSLASLEAQDGVRLLLSLEI